MSDEERKKKIETMKALIKAECLRITELLNSEEDLTGYSCGPNSVKSNLRSKMLEVRKDTMRLDHLMYHNPYIE